MLNIRSGGRGLGFALAPLVLAAASAAGDGGNVIHVDDDAPAGGDGSSWKCAFNDLQRALAVVTEGDEIRVGQGLYKPAPPNGPREATFNLVNGTILRGGYAGIGADDPDANDPVKFESILSGDLNGDDEPWFQNNAENVYHILTATDEIQASALVRDLTVTAANANVVGPDGVGGGLRCHGSAAPTLQGVAFLRNFARSGAGLFAETGALKAIKCTFYDNFVPPGTGGTAGAAVGGPAEFIECLFEKNRAPAAGMLDGGEGGLAGAQARIYHCTFRENDSHDAAALRGGAMIVNTVFYRNTASSTDGYGGAVISNGIFINCEFVGNSAYMGGAVRQFSGTGPTFVNCSFRGNYSGSHGGAASVTAGTFINCTIVGNRSHYANTIHKSNSTGGLVVANCVLWANDNVSGNISQQAAQIGVSQGTATITNSCILGWDGTLGGPNNHGNDPRFVNAAGPDGVYGTEDDNPRLLANSPLIDRGNSIALPPDSFDLDQDGDTSEPLPLDLDWLPRIVGQTVDVGAFEFQGQPCLADITGDSTVNVNDLLAVVNAWGPCVAAQPCNADLTLDGSVGVNDLLLIINQWGSCP